VYLAKSIVEESDENQSAIKLIVANGDEGDPGAFMDRTLIQERPHQVIEGMILAALAVAARYGVIYVRKEYEDAVRRLEHALFQARRKGLLGENIFSAAGLHFDIEIRLGAGAFVAGEKRAIMRAIEGEPAEPTLNAASNTYRGLWGKPTLLNNVETFANAPLIIQRGGNWYARQGTEQSGGSKIFSVAGIVKQTGLVEVRFGRTLDDIVRICGGIQDGKRLAGVQIGGPSGAILSLTGVRSYLMYTPLDFDTFDQVGAMLGSGGLVFIGEDDDVVRLARHFTDWLAEESCGQCPPCMQGTVSLGKTLDVILQGEGASDHLHALWAKSDAIKAGSQCGLGTTSANPVTSALRFFPHAFLHYLLGNPRLNRLELFRVLEGLRLLTRGNVERIAARRRQVVGYSFVLKKHLLRHLVNELERLDQYRPTPQRRTRHFLALLQVRPHEVGTRDVGIECTLEELEQHRQYLQDVYGETTRSGFADAV
jgi:NADH-quinone oxidoreductase subunit F/NADP-reducing hydrogenase subunit HndC